MTLALLGAYHGVNPAMGWLFAVGKGLQDGERKSVFRALPPIALGHALSIAGVAALAVTARIFIDPRVLRWVSAGALIAFGLLLLAKKIRHRWVGMRVGFKQLTGWSFLMSTAHGAGLMLVPAMLALPKLQFHCSIGSPAAAAASSVSTAPTVAAAGLRLTAAPGASPLQQGLAAVSIHTLAMLLVASIIALLVFNRLGLKVLRTAWINLDLVWALALVVAGLLMLAL